MKKIIILLAIVLVGTCALQAQEVLTGLVVNKSAAREARKAAPASARVAALHLPFVDDFSNYTGTPDPTLWQDRYAYVNRSFGLMPPTMGVVTLDALDENGRVYAHADNAGFHADKLTSQPIRLDYNFSGNHQMSAADHVYLSFYYQPAGGTLSGLEWERVGNRPEGRDSLVLEFGYATGNIVFQGYTYCDYYLGEDESYIVGDTLENPFMAHNYYVFETSAFPGDLISLPCDSIMGEEMYWEHIWSTPGVSLDEWLAENPLQYFRQVLIPISDNRWFINNFQFRFRNMASLEDNGVVGWASNVDQWNIDYVRLGTNRSDDDLYPEDLAFVMPTTSILKEYQAMPWRHYRDSDLDNAFANTLANISNSVKNSYYSYNIRRVGGGNVATYTPNNENAQPYYNHGLHDVPAHVSPAFNFTSLNPDGADSASFIVTHIFQEVGTGDQRRCNDTCVFEQKFSDYFAYDDGSAEAGYSILSTLTHPAAYLAMRFKMAQPDTLRAVKMWFNSVLEDANDAYFTLLVWNDDNGRPGDVLYQRESMMPKHAECFEDFATYFIDDTLVLDGTFYVGFYQDHSVQLNLGFDQNTDSRAHFMYKTSAEWQEPFLRGTPMIRAVVGSPADLSPVREVAASDFRIYPNPVRDALTVEIADPMSVNACSVYDAFGRLAFSQPISGTTARLSVSSLSPGIYFLRLLGDGGVVGVEKFVKAR